MKVLGQGMSAATAVAAVMLGLPRPALAQDVRLAPQPDVVIGALDGDLAYLFDHIVAAAFAPDGRIVVADGGARALRVFDSKGRFVREMGAPGQGPGEFTALSGLWLTAPDTVGVWDATASRLTRFTLDGGRVDTRRVQPDASVPGTPQLWAGPLPDGSVVAGSLALGDPDREGRRTDQLHLTRFGEDGEALGTLARMDGMVRRKMGAMFGPVPFSPFAFAAVLGDSVVFTDGVEPLVRIRAVGGGGRDIPLPPHTPPMSQAWDDLESRQDHLPGWASDLQDVPRDDPLPHHAGLLVDDAGAIWTKAYQPSADGLWLRGNGGVRGGTWWIAGPEPDRIRTVALPPALHPLAVEGDRLLGVTTDGFGVERVVVYRMEAGSRP